MAVLSIKIAALPWNDMKHKEKGIQRGWVQERGICIEVLDLIPEFVKLFLLLVLVLEKLEILRWIRTSINLQLQTPDSSVIKQCKRAVSFILKVHRFKLENENNLILFTACLYGEHVRRFYGWYWKEVPVLGNSEASDVTSASTSVVSFNFSLGMHEDQSSNQITGRFAWFYCTIFK